MKQYFIATLSLYYIFVILIPSVCNAQNLDASKFEKIVISFEKFESINVHIFNKDTLITIPSKSSKRYIVAPAFNYYGTDGKSKIEVKEMQKEAIINGKTIGFTVLKKSIIFIGKIYPKTALKNIGNTTIDTVNEVSGNKKVDLTEVIPFNPKGTKIFLYAEPNYKGKPLIIDAEGEYDFAAVMTTWNNTISSAKIPKGYSITFYDERHKDGGELPVSGEVESNTAKGLSIPNFKKLTCFYGAPNLSDNDFGVKKTVNFDNKVSFIEVIKL